MRKFIIMMSLLPAVSLANPYMHQPNDGGNMPPPPPPSPCMMGDETPLPPYLYQLDLTDAQRQQIQDLIKNKSSKMKDDHKLEDALRDQIHQLSFSSDYDKAKLVELTDQLSQFHKQQMIERAELDHAIFAKLTNSQQQKLIMRMQAFDRGHLRH